MISIESMTAYHAAFDIPMRIGWFVDAIQSLERIRLDMQSGNDAPVEESD